MREDRPPPEFVQKLHRILRHLYEPAELHRSLMLEWLGIQSRPDSGAALRRILLDTIQSLKPDAKAPRDASGWRIYQVLTYRFVDQSSQSGVADELALSIRQLRRLEKSAVRALAEILFARYDFKSQASEIKDAAPVEPIQPTQASLTSTPSYPLCSVLSLSVMDYWKI